jgi:hypothetical protein
LQYICPTLTTYELLMKKLLCLPVFVVLLTIFSTSNVLGQKENDDSLSVVIPTTIEANLDMIVAPDVFEISKAFKGYISIPNSSAIMMTLIQDVNFLKIDEGMTPEFYAQNQLNFISKSDFISDKGVKGKYYKLSFELKGDKFIRYMVYAGDLKQTLWLNVTYPQSLETLLEEEILKCFQTINLNPTSDEK